MIWSLLFSVYSFACVILPSSNGLNGQWAPFTFDLGTSVTLTASGCGTIDRWEYVEPTTVFAGNTGDVTITTGSGPFSARRGYFIRVVGSSGSANITIWTGKRPQTPQPTASVCEIDPDVGLNKVTISNSLPDEDPEPYSTMSYEWVVDDENLGFEYATNSDGTTEQDIYLRAGGHLIKLRAVKIYENTPTYPGRYANLTSVFSDPVFVSCPQICDSMENCLEPGMNFLGKPTNAPCRDHTCGGHPVNLGSGALWHQNTDYSIRGRTAQSNLILTRTFLSDNFEGDFGNWHHNFGSKLQILNSRNIVWHDENGGKWMFFWQTGNIYAAPSGEKMKLAKAADSYVLEKEDRTKIIFSLTGKLLSMTDRHGEVTSLAYDSSGKIESVAVPFAGSLLFTRNEQGRIATVTSTRDNLTTAYAYNGEGKLVSVADFDGKVYEYTYVTDMAGTAAQGLLASIKDPLSRLYKFTYYPDGRAHTQVEPDGAVRVFQYIGERPTLGRKGKKTPAASTFATIYKEIDGVVSHYIFDENYRTIEVTNPDQSKTQKVWNAAGLVGGAIDELGHETTFSYDENNNLISVQRPGIGSATQITYDPDFRVPTLIQPAVGAPTTNYINNLNGDISGTQRTDGGSTLSLGFARDDFGNLLSVNNGRSSYTYARDENGLMTGVFDSHNPETRAYDGRGRLSTRSFQSGRVVSYGYDNYDRIVSIDDSHGPDVSQVFDAMGRLLSRSVSDGSQMNTTSYVWDVHDRLVRETDALGRITRYGYDKWRVLQTPSSITDPAGRTTRFKFDARKRLVKKIDAKGAETSFQYNSRGDLIAVTDTLGQVTNYQYDAAGRKIFESRPSVMDASATTHDIGFEYDDLDRLIKETHYSKSGGANRIINYAYDAFDRLKSRTLMIGSVVEDFATYSYENQLDADSIKNINNSVANLSFSNEPSPPFSITGYSIAATEGGNPKGLLEDSFTVARDVTGNIAGVTGSNAGVVFTKAYDPAGRLTGFNARQGALKGAIAYDGFGRKEKISYSDGASSTYAYDLLNRVTAINWKENYKDSVRQHLTYDLAGNVSHMAREHSTYDLNYDPADQLTKSVFKGLQGVPGYNREFSYDPVGNRLNDSHGNTLSEFVSNFLVRNGQSNFLAHPDGFGETVQETTGTITKNYSYRADGKISGFTSGAVSVGYHYDGLGRLMAKTINDGSSYTQSFVHLGIENRVLLGKAGDGSVTTYIDGQGIAERLGEVKNGIGKGYITDHLGSVLNSPVAGAWKTYGLFGEDSASVAPKSSMNAVIYGFQGYSYDVATGQYETESGRLYMPQIGRWNAQEPFGLDGPNLYWSFFNNPVRYSDPTGYASVPAGEAGGYSGYPSADAAAKDILNGINPASKAANLEISGDIYREKDGTYSSGNFEVLGPAGGNVSPGSTNCPPVASFHTHGGYDSRYDNENFSEADRNYSRKRMIPEYLATPSDRIKVYDPKTGRERDLR